MLGKRLSLGHPFLVVFIASFPFLPDVAFRGLKTISPAWPQPPTGRPTSTQAEITFRAQVPAGTSPASVFIDILDEVTGLS